MRLCKMLRSLLVVVLIISMVLPNFAFGVLADGQTEKAKMELVYMVYDDTLSGGLKYKEAEIPEITDTHAFTATSQNADNEFFVGVKVTDLDHIAEATGKVNQITTAIVYDYAYLSAESEMGSQLMMAWGNRVFVEGTPFESDYAYVSAANIYTGVDFGGDNGSPVGTGTDALSFDLKFSESRDVPTPTYDGSGSVYLAIMKFKLKKLPDDTENGVQLFDFVDFPVGSTSYTTLGFGLNNTTGLKYESGLTDSRDIHNVMTFDESSANLFPATYNIVYDENVTGHTPALTPTMGTDGDSTVKAGQTISALRTGSATSADDKSWAVTSWTLEPEGGTTITPGETVITDAMINTDTDDDGVNDTLTLYAQWEQKVVITLDANGGTLADGAENPILLPGDVTTLTLAGKSLPTVSRDSAYTFKGWYAASEGTDGKNYYTVSDSQKRDESYDISATGSETWFAAWETNDTADKKTVTFKANDGTDTTVATVTVDNGDSINAVAAEGQNMPVPPTRTDYVFNGWNTQANGGGEAFDGTTQITEDTTVYAQWTADLKNPYWTVTFNANAADATVKPTEYKVPQGGVTVDSSLIPTGTRTGYVATEWYVDISTDGSLTKGAKYDTTYTINGNITVFPEWEQAVTLNLHPNDGKDHDATATDDADKLTITAYNGKPLTAVPEYDETQIKKDNRDGNYVLLGWSTQSQWKSGKTWDQLTADEKVVDLEDSENPVYNNITTAMNGTDLYAWWSLDITPAATAGALTYTGKDQAWDDTLATKAVVFNSYNEAGDTATAEALKFGAAEDYTVEIYATAHPDHTDTAVTAFKAATKYCVHFTNVNPEINFDPANLQVAVDKATVKLEVTPTVPPTNEDEHADPVLPDIKVTLGDATDPLDPADPDDKALIDDILKELNFVYYRLDAGTPVGTGVTINAGDIAENWETTTKSNPYLAGDYVVAVQPGTDCGYELASTSGFTLSDPSKALNFTTSNPKLGADWKNDPTNFGANPNAFLLHVEANSRTVTFKKSADAGTLNTMIDHASVTVKNNSAISNTESNPGVTMPGDPEKFDNLEFQGWFIVDKNADVTKLHEAAFAKYEAWKAITDDATNAAEERAKLKFTADSIVSDNLTVVAVWTASTDSGLKDPDPDAVPADHVGGLKLATKNSEAETPTYVEITQFYEENYTTPKDFKAEQEAPATNNYYVRVANDQDMLKITLESNEPNSKVAVSKVTFDEEGNNEVSSTPIITVADNVKTKEDIALDVAVKGSANIYKIEVFAPDGTSKSTYYVYVQRMAKAEIKLNYGNSPYGLIMKDDAITDKETAKTAFVTDGFTFTSNLPAGASSTTVYTSIAWGDSVDAEINKDLDEEAIFVYNWENFYDPGFTATDSLGNPIDAANVTMSLPVKVMAGPGASGLGNVTDGTISITNEDGNYLFDMSSNAFAYGVRPGVYELSYNFTDPYLPATDEDSDGKADNEITKVRYVVVLNMLGDADNSQTLAPLDRTEISNVLGGRVSYINVPDAVVSLFRFRVMDADNSGSLAPLDGTEIARILGGGTAIRFYAALSKNS